MSSYTLRVRGYCFPKLRLQIYVFPLSEWVVVGGKGNLGVAKPEFPFPQRPPIPFGRRSNPNKSEIGRPIHSYTFPTYVRVTVVHSSHKSKHIFLGNT